MQWIKNGPDLPAELLQFLEDGRLAFFCGAGVSYPAGLPTFKGLVKKVYERLGEPFKALEHSEFEQCNYDRVFGLLEKRVGPSFVRRTVIEILKIEPGTSLRSHEALLALATSHDGMCRLVTTNFDRGFEFAALGKIKIDAAPKLSVPKLGAWNCVIHLHGLINDVDPDGRSLVLTSADFGAAYLTERWASRFISELFRRFAVLFVGYSIEDPVIRYMMDAFAADRALGEGAGAAFVLAGTTEANREKSLAAWAAKGVRPVLYDEAEDHKTLHQTLIKWAECHQNGLLGRESIIRDHCSSKKPIKPFDEDPAVTQVLWAVSEVTGHNAEVFAELDPVPPLEWLDVFVEHKLLESTVSSSNDAAKTPLVDSGYRTNFPQQLDPATRALGKWLSRHMENSVLLDWIIDCGASLHPEFRRVVQHYLAKDESLPPGLRTVWSVLSREPNSLSMNLSHSYSAAMASISKGNWDIRLRHDLVAAIMPEFTIRKSLRRSFYPDSPLDVSNAASYAELDIVLRCRTECSVIRHGIEQSPKKTTVLCDLSDDLTGLLKLTMEMFEIIDKADGRRDPSYSDQPSISAHPQNTGFAQWTFLIELLRDAWQHLRDVNRNHARSMVERWRTIPYPVFRRLTFYAMAESDLHTPQECLTYLLEDNGWWLSSIHVYREKFRLLNCIWPKLTDAEAVHLTQAIIGGPPRTMFSEDISDEEVRQMADRSKWLHLAKLRNWGRELPAAAEDVFKDLTSRNPGWQLREEDRDEFLLWMEASVDEVPGENDNEFLEATDETIVARLMANDQVANNLLKWEHLIANNPSRATELISAIAAKGQWPNELWNPFLQGVGRSKSAAHEWPGFIEALLAASEEFFETSCRQVAWLLHDVSSSLANEADEDFWKLWDRASTYSFRDEEGARLGNDPVGGAINAPSGLLVEALLERLAAKRPRAGTDIGDRNWARLTTITQGTSVAHTYGRVVLASRLAWLHNLNKTWVEQHLLPFFDWSRSSEAEVAWQGYLWQARVTPELWEVVKHNFLVALREKEKLRGFAEQITTLFAYICLDRPDWFSTVETRNALQSMDDRGLGSVARVIFHRLQGAGEKAKSMWETLISGWISLNWPKETIKVYPSSALNLALAATYTTDAFASAVVCIKPFIIGSEDYSYVVERLTETELPERYPDSVLSLLDIVDTHYEWPSHTLRKLLMRLQSTQPGIVNELKFRNLNEYLLSHHL